MDCTRRRPRMAAGLREKMREYTLEETTIDLLEREGFTTHLCLSKVDDTSVVAALAKFTLPSAQLAALLTLIHDSRGSRHGQRFQPSRQKSSKGYRSRQQSDRTRIRDDRQPSPPRAITSRNPVTGELLQEFKRIVKVEGVVDSLARSGVISDAVREAILQEKGEEEKGEEEEEEEAEEEEDQRAELLLAAVDAGGERACFLLYLALLETGQIDAAVLLQDIYPALVRESEECTDNATYTRIRRGARSVWTYINLVLILMGSALLMCVVFNLRIGPFTLYWRRLTVISLVSVIVAVSIAGYIHKRIYRPLYLTKVTLGISKLMLAVIREEAAVVSRLLREGADPNMTSCGDVTALHVACQTGQVRLAKTLINHGADIHAQDRGGFTCVRYANHSARNRNDIVTYLASLTPGLEHDSGDVSCETKQQITVELPLHVGRDCVDGLHMSDHVATVQKGQMCYSCASSDVTTIKHHLNADYDVSTAMDDGDTALIRACRTGDVRVVKQLLDNGANVEQPDSDGLRPLHVACRHNHVHVVRELLQHGAQTDVYCRGNQLPCGYGTSEQCKKLIHDWIHSPRRSRIDVSEWVKKSSPEAGGTPEDSYLTGDSGVSLEVKGQVNRHPSTLVPLATSSPRQPAGLQPRHMAAKTNTHQSLKTSHREVNFTASGNTGYKRYVSYESSTVNNDVRYRRTTTSVRPKLQWSSSMEGRVWDLSSGGAGGSVWVRKSGGGGEGGLCEYNSAGERLQTLSVDLDTDWGGMCVDETRGYAVMADGNKLACVSSTGDCKRVIVVRDAGMLGGVVHCAEDDVYVVADTHAHCLWFISGHSGDVLFEVTCRVWAEDRHQGSLAPGNLYHHHRGGDGDVSSTCHVYVSDQMNHCVCVYTAGGDYVRRFGEPGGGRGELSCPCGVCVDGRGRVVVCDSGNARVVRYWWEEGGRQRWEEVLSKSQLNGGRPTSIDITEGSGMLVGVEAKSEFSLLSFTYDA